MNHKIRITWYEKRDNNRLLEKEMRKIEIESLDLIIIERIITKRYPGFCSDYLWEYTFVR